MLGEPTPVTAAPLSRSANYIRAMPIIDLTDDEHAAVAAAMRRAIEDDRFPHAPRLDPLRAALTARRSDGGELDAVTGRSTGTAAKLDAVTAAKLPPQPKARTPVRGDKPTRR